MDASVKTAVDPSYRRRLPLAGARRLPAYVVVDVRSMEVRAILADPGPEELLAQLRSELAALDGGGGPIDAPAAVFDGRFNREQWAMIHDMRLPAAPSPNPSNDHADDGAAAALGRVLFEDTGLAPGTNLSCATCHAADKQFADGVAQSEGLAKLDRNSPSITLASHARSQFWDGRADSLWAQALGPLENENELGSSRLFVAHRVFATHRAAYEAAFPEHPLPDLGDATRFPASGKPGSAAYDAMSASDKEAVTRSYVNVGKAIEAFERTLRAKPNALDRYVDGDLGALDEAQKTGLLRFFTAGCAQCHYGPRLTDDAFHNVRFPSGRQDGAPDPGRQAVLSTLVEREFSAASVWSDSQTPPRTARPNPFALGQFKTPPLRGVARTAPYGHGGTLGTIADVVDHYGRGLPGPAAVGEPDPWVVRFDPGVRGPLIRFLEVLSADPE